MSIADRIQRFRGCRYPDTLPDGRTARVQWGVGVIDPDGATIPFPPGATAFDCLRIGPTGSIAGTANVNRTDFAWVWGGYGWLNFGAAPGRNAVAWGPDGSLYVIRSRDRAEVFQPNGSIKTVYGEFGPLGLRFIAWDGRIVTTAETYADVSRGLYEYTDWGDCAIGQGGKPDQGVVVRFADDGILRRFHLGADRDVRWERDGNQIAVSWTAQTTDEACVWMGTMEELRMLEPVSTPEPEPEPEPPPPPSTSRDSLISGDGRFRAVMQSDGNLVVYGPGGTAKGITGTWQEWGGQPTPGPTPEPQPQPQPVPAHNQLAASFYTAIGDPRLDTEEFSHRLRDLGCTGTRAWLVSAWAVDFGGPGQIAGWMPWLKVDDRFDLWTVTEAYLARLYNFVHDMNVAGITPMLTGWELYSWSDAKAGMLWVPDPNLGPFRNNIQGIKYGQGRIGTFDGVKFANPDDEALIVEIGSDAGEHRFLGHFYAEVVKTLRGLRYSVEVGNEMPEKGLNLRLRNLWQQAGFNGWIQVNRNQDTPGQFDNMRIGQADGFDGIAYHGKRDLGYLDEEFPDEAPAGRPTTFRSFYALNPDPDRITLSSDGCRKTTDVADAYDYPALTAVAKDAIGRGFEYEHQLALKLRTFTHNRLDLADIQYDSVFLKGLQT